VSTRNNNSSPVSKRSVRKRLPPLPAAPLTLVKDASAGRIGRCEDSANHLGIVIQEHKNTRHTQEPINRTRDASRRGVTVMGLISAVSVKWSYGPPIGPLNELAGVPETRF